MEGLYVICDKHRPDTWEARPDHTTACPPIYKAISLTLASMKTSRKPHVSELITGDRSSSIISSVGVPCDATIWMKADNELRLPQNCCGNRQRSGIYTHTCCRCCDRGDNGGGSWIVEPASATRYNRGIIRVRGTEIAQGIIITIYFQGTYIAINVPLRWIKPMADTAADAREDVGSATAATPVASHCANSHLHGLADVYQSGHLPVTSTDEVVLITFTPVIESKQHWLRSWCTPCITLIFIRLFRITPEYPWSMLITSESQDLLLISNFSRSNYECWTEATTSIQMKCMLTKCNI